MILLTTLGCGNETQMTPGQHAQTFEKDITMHMKLKYLLYLPQEYPASNQDWPLVLFLHGAGERGDDLNKVKIHGPAMLVAKQNKQFPFILVSPQCPEEGWWSSDVQIATLDALLDDIVARYRVDTNRIYVTGLSMGGYGTWRLAAKYPNRFAAIAPICGDGNPKDAAVLAHIPAWVFHGAKDDVVPVDKSETMVEALQAVNAHEVKFTIYPEAGQDSWTETYNNPELYDWLLTHTRSNRK